jgi:WD40 repeat protein
MSASLRTITAEGHAEAVFCLAYSPDAKYLATGGDAGEIVLWNVADWSQLRQLKADAAGRDGHRDDVWGVAFSPDGSRLASAAHDETVRLWDVESGRQTAILKGHTFHVWGVAFSPDGRRLASAGGVSGSSGEFTAGEIIVWDIEAGSVLSRMGVPTSRVYSVAFHPEGTTLASGWEDHEIRVWDIASQRELYALSGHAGEVNVVAWHPQGQLLVSAGEDRTVRLWNTKERREIRRRQDYHGAAFSGDGARLVTAGAAGLAIWDTASGGELHRSEGSQSFSRLAFRPDGEQAAWDHGVHAIRVWTPRR